MIGKRPLKKHVDKITPGRVFWAAGGYPLFSVEKFLIILYLGAG